MDTVDHSLFDGNPINQSSTNSSGFTEQGGSSGNAQEATNGNVQETTNNGNFQDATNDIVQKDSTSSPSLYYDMSGKKIMVIFNHFQYQKSRHFEHPLQPRNGTHHDVKALRNVFNKLGFKITTCTDNTHSEIINVMQNFAREDHSKTSCFVVVILTHGHSGGMVCAADRPYPIKDLFRILETGDSGLVNKPKLFFVQACRGHKTDTGRMVQNDGAVESSILVPSHIDFLVMQSAVEDHISWRESDGSWMIQELCEVMATHHHNMDLLHMITLVNHKVAYKRASSTRNIKTHNKKQTLETRFTLTKLVKF